MLGPRSCSHPGGHALWGPGRRRHVKGSCNIRTKPCHDISSSCVCKSSSWIALKTRPPEPRYFLPSPLLLSAFLLYRARIVASFSRTSRESYSVSFNQRSEFCSRTKSRPSGFTPTSFIMEGDPRLEKTDAIIEHRDIPNYANSVRSTAPLLESTSPSPAIRPTAERNGSRVIPSSSKRRIHTWRSPLLMVVFYILGLSLSVAHCVFYPKLKGRIVGDSGQQEEKIR
jgi:hypothetical protein